jgi:hypothetical protein
MEDKYTPIYISWYANVYILSLSFAKRVYSDKLNAINVYTILGGYGVWFLGLGLL